jgi:phosphopantothenoylcysteine decarboxylase/phosphopantothenate--cysteine ligase
VADYAPVQVSTSKIKKAGNVLNIELHKTKDILKELGKLKKKKQLLIGFALETDNEEANALKKMKEKNLDFIVLNSLNDKGAGFGFDTNQISILHSNGTKKSFGLKPKKDVAQDIVEQIIQLLHV